MEKQVLSSDKTENEDALGISFSDSRWWLWAVVAGPENGQQQIPRYSKLRILR